MYSEIRISVTCTLLSIPGKVSIGRASLDYYGTELVLIRKNEESVRLSYLNSHGEEIYTEGIDLEDCYIRLALISNLEIAQFVCNHLGVNSLSTLSESIHKNNKDKGFWDGEVNVGEKLMLVVSELSEALEVHRMNDSKKANLSEHLQDLKMIKLANYNSEETRVKHLKESYEDLIKGCFEEEIADAIIRLLDLCEGLGIDLTNHLKLKVEYNKLRAYKHGKKY